MEQTVRVQKTAKNRNANGGLKSMKKSNLLAMGMIIAVVMLLAAMGSTPGLLAGPCRS
jgi:hypothetical protein